MYEMYLHRSRSRVNKSLYARGPVGQVGRSRTFRIWRAGAIC